MAVRRESVRVDADVSPFVRGMATASAAASGFAHNLDQADGRMANLVQAGLALAPALVPIGAVAVPAIAGLTTQLGFAVGAAGAAVLAFQGVGTALKAVHDFQAAPTAAGLEKVKEAFDQLGPAAGEFVLFLNDLTPRLDALKNVSAEGLFPGMQEGITSLLDLQPRIQRILSEMADSSGDLLAQAGENLAGPGWEKFFTYLETTARPMLTDMGQTFGNFTQGFANMVMAFDPLSRDFSSGFLDMSRSFNEWTQGLEGSQGFSNFVDYIRDSGPQVADTLGALAMAIVGLLEAAAPVGAIVLPALEGVAKAISALADSSAGPAIIGIAAAIGVLGRSMALLKAVGIRGGADGQMGAIGSALGVDKMKGILPAMREYTAATDTLRVAEAKRIEAQRRAVGIQSALVPDKAKRAALDDFIAANKEVERASKGVTAAWKGQFSAIRSGAAAFGKSAALAGGLAVATSGLADGLGLSNTASMALMGTLAGPWGAAVGGGVGLVMDLAGANNSLEDSMRNLNLSAENAWDFSGQEKALAGAKASLQDYQGLLSDATSFGVGSPKATLTWVSDLFTNTGEESAKAVTETENNMARMQASVRELATEFSGDNKFMTLPFAEMGDEISFMQAALQRANLDLKDFQPNDPADWVRYINAMHDYGEATDSASGRSKAVAAALADMDNEFGATATAAETLKSSLDALFGPGLNQSAATDAWTQSLQDLRAELAPVSDLLHGTGDAALEARDRIRASVGALTDKVSADAAAGVSGRKLVDSLLAGRDAIVKQGVAAGLNRGQIQAYLKTLGLTPKNLTTIITADGALSAKQKVEALAQVYKLTPRQVKTLVSEAGSNPTMSKIKALARQYDLTPKQVKTFLEAVDNASKKMRDVQNEADKTGHKAPRVVVSALVGDALGGIRQVLGALNLLHDKSITLTTTHRTVYTTSGAGHGMGGGTVDADGSIHEFYANGGLFPRIGDQQPQIRPYSGPRGLTWGEEGSGPWEAFISGAPQKADRSRAIATEVVNRLGGTTMFANGGVANYAPAVSQTAPSSRAVTVQFNGPITTTDAKALARETAQRQRDVLALVNQP